MVVGVTLAYALFLLRAYHAIGIGAAAASALPVVVAAWLFGQRAGLAAALCGVGLNTLLLNLLGAHDWAIAFTHGGAPGTSMLFVTGLVVGRLRDLGERLREAQERLSHAATHDALTGLPNRRLFDDRLRAEMARAHRLEQSLAVFFLDLDCFKAANDSLGHTTGDALLQSVAQRLIATVRESDTVARLGGDEFLFILPACSDDAAVVAQQVLAAFSTPFAIDGHEIQLGASVGISLYPDHGADAETLIRNADAALYRVKDGGRNAYAFCAGDAAAAIAS